MPCSAAACGVPAMKSSRCAIVAGSARPAATCAERSPQASALRQWNSLLAFGTQELAHCSGVTHEEAFDVRRPIAGFGLNLPQEWRGVLVCSRREVKRENVPLKTAAVHCDIIVLPAEFTEHSFKLILYCDMPASLHIDARHSHAIPNWRVHGASILEENRERRTRSRISGRYLDLPPLNWAGVAADFQCSASEPALDVRASLLAHIRAKLCRH